MADAGNHRIQKFTSSGIYLGQWGSEGTENGQFDHPRSVAVDGQGNVYVVDSSNNRIQKFNSNGGYITSYFPATGQFANPNGVAVDKRGNIYVADTGSSRLLSYYPPGQAASMVPMLEMLLLQ